MKKFIDYHCKHCKAVTKMKVSGPAEALGVYWLRCSRCSNNWKVPIEEIEKLVS